MHLESDLSIIMKNVPPTNKKTFTIQQYEITKSINFVKTTL